MRESDVVAVWNSSVDTTDMLRMFLERAGFVVVTAFTNELRDGKVDLESFVRQHNPRVVIYDVSIPYEEHWRLFQHLRNTPAMKGIQFVVTTTNVKQVEKVAGSGQGLIEIVGKPYDLNLLVDAVRAALTASRH